MSVGCAGRAVGLKTDGPLDCQVLPGRRVARDRRRAALWGARDGRDVRSVGSAALATPSGSGGFGDHRRAGAAKPRPRAVRRAAAACMAFGAVLARSLTLDGAPVAELAILLLAATIVWFDRRRLGASPDAIAGGQSHERNPIPRALLPPLPALAAVLAVVCAGCATPPADPAARAEFDKTNDPLEPTNREVFGANQFHRSQCPETGGPSVPGLDSRRHAHWYPQSAR